MDLSKVTLPTYVLERRSLLEMYADFFVHPDDFVLPNSLDSAEERFVLDQIKWRKNFVVFQFLGRCALLSQLIPASTPN